MLVCIRSSLLLISTPFFVALPAIASESLLKSTKPYVPWASFSFETMVLSSTRLTHVSNGQVESFVAVKYVLTASYADSTVIRRANAFSPFQSSRRV